MNKKVTELISILIPIFLIIGGFIIFRKRRTKRLYHNLKQIANILNKKINSSSLGGKKFVEGYYKDRKVRFKVDFSNKIPVAEISIVPNYIPPNCKKSDSHVFYPNPTENTAWHYDKEKIFFLFLPGKSFSYNKTLSKNEFLEILEKLTNAAEVIENNSSFYKK